MISWFAVPYLAYPSDNPIVPQLYREIFPGLVVIATVLVSFFGFVLCGWPNVSMVAPKRPFRTDAELIFLNLVSLEQVLSITLFLFTQIYFFVFIAFASEIAFCVWESIYLGRSRRLPVESITHHICTIFAIFMSLYVPDIPLGLLVQLSLSVSVGNVIVCTSKLMYRKSDRREKMKKIGISVSFWFSILYRIVIPTINVGWIMFHFFFRLDALDRPGWTRLYLTFLLMLLALNYQMVSFMKR